MATSSVALPALKRLTIKDLIDFSHANVDKDLLFGRAIKVFLASYSAHQSMTSEIQKMYRKYFDAYCAIMSEVFKPTQTIDTVVNSMEAELRAESVELRVGIIRAKNIDNKAGTPLATIETNITGQQQPYVFLLDPQSEDQKHTPFETVIQFTEFVKMKTKSNVCKISLTIGEKTQSINIAYRQIHAEGYIAWHTLMGVEVLIRVHIHHTEAVPLEAQRAHLASIAYVIRYRLEKTIDTNQKNYSRVMAKWHNSAAVKRNIEPLQKEIPPESSLAFWPKPLIRGDDNPYDTRHELRLDLTFGRKAHFHDLNVLMFDDMFEDKPFCVCTEWCNLGAFYYHNPELRFFMTQHNLLYVENPRLVANHYLAIICNEMTFPTTNDIKFRPLFQLMKSAFDYTQRIAERAAKDSNFRIGLIIANPPIRTVNGITYMLLRDTIHPKLAVVTTDAPFSDTSIENIRTYYLILEEFHRIIGSDINFVPKDSLDIWYNELQGLCRHWYHHYIDTNFRTLLSDGRFIEEDFLFSKVYDIGTGNDDHWNVWRPRIRQFKDNPMNPKFTNDSFLSCFIRFIKFLVNIEPYLLEPRTLRGLRMEKEFVVAFDQMLCRLLTVKDFVKNYCRASIVKGQDISAEKELYSTLFYNLKIYSNAYRMQKYFTNYVIKYNVKCKYMGPTYVPLGLAFVFRNDWIEGTIVYVRTGGLTVLRDGLKELLDEDTVGIARTVGRTLFRIGAQELMDGFKAFYDNFWPKELHERQPNVMTNALCNSVFKHYKRQYLWTKITGKQKNIFTNILKTFRELNDKCIEKSETIYLSQILKYFIDFNDKYEHSVEVVDQLVIFLIRADCYILISIAAKLLQSIHGLSKDDFVLNHQSFILCKPGLVDLNNTSRVCYETINQLNHLYIIYDDENNTIAKTIDETRISIKQMYRDLYRQLTVEWANEVENILNGWMTSSATDDNQYADVLRLHLVTGLSFMAAYIDDFRYESLRIRKQLNKHYRPNQPTSDRKQETFIEVWRIYQDHYLKDKTEVKRAVPFQCTIWLQVLQNIIPSFNARQVQTK